jgi:hypothetical protein
MFRKLSYGAESACLAEILNFKYADNEHLKDAHGLTDHEYQAMYPKTLYL